MPVSVPWEGVFVTREKGGGGRGGDNIASTDGTSLVEGSWGLL